MFTHIAVVGNNNMFFLQSYKWEVDIRMVEIIHRHEGKGGNYMKERNLKFQSTQISTYIKTMQ